MTGAKRKREDIIEVNMDASRVYVMDVRANLIRVLAPRKK